MSIICISRGSYYRGKEVAEKVAALLGYECVSRDSLLAASDEFGIAEIKLTRNIQHATQILERYSFGRERYINYISAAILKRLKRDNHVYHGLAGQFFPLRPLGLLALKPAGVGKVDHADFPFLQGIKGGFDGIIDLQYALFSLDGELLHMDFNGDFLLQVGHDRSHAFPLTAGNGAGLFILRSTHMGHEDGPSSLFQDRIEGAEGAVDAVGILNRSLFDHVMIHPDENQPVFQIRLLDTS